MKRTVPELIEDINKIVSISKELTKQAQEVTNKAIILRGDLRDFFDMKMPPYEPNIEEQARKDYTVIEKEAIQKKEE